MFLDSGAISDDGDSLIRSNFEIFIVKGKANGNGNGIKVESS